MADATTTDLKPYIGAEIPSLTDSLRANILAKTGQDIPFEIVAEWLSLYVENNKKEHFNLSKTRPDFEGIKIQFIARVRQTKPWKDIITAGWAQTLSEFFAAIGDYGQTSILRAYQEGGPEARLSSSIYRQMRSLGVAIDRAIPARVSVNLWCKDVVNQVIPELSQFSVNNRAFFNRTPIQFNGNTSALNPVSVVLYEGRIVTEDYVSRGVPFQYFEIGDEDSNISNLDLYCFTGSGVEYTGVTDGLWHHEKNEKVFYENMAPNGTVEVLFGNDVFGAVPPINEVLHFMYADTVGSQANSALVNLTVSLTSINENVPNRIRNTDTLTIDDQIEFLVTGTDGTSSSTIDAGDDLKDKEFYRAVGPGIRASNRRMVNRIDHYSQGLRYPGLADILFQGQKELAPRDRRFTNVIGVSVLKRDGIPMLPEEWSIFVDYLTSLGIWGRGIEYLRIDPTPRIFNISGDVYMTKNSDTSNVGAYLRYQFSNFFRFQRGSIGKSVYGSDIEDLFKFSYGDMTVDFANNILPNPNTDAILGKTEYPVLGSLIPNIKYSGRDTRFQPPREL